MTDIDWSKAPEGATHYIPETADFHACWARKNDSVEWETWVIASGTRWVERKNLDCFAIEKPWTGEGLPPVGAVCEVLNPELSRAEWEKCTVLFVGKHRILYDSESCSERCGYVETLEFRSIRTPEQIAEEEREKAIAEINEVLGFGPAHDVGERLYLAGYRKREAV